MNCAADGATKRPRFLTIEQVADELNVGLPTVRMLLKSGELRGIQIGGRGYLVQIVQSRPVLPRNHWAVPLTVFSFLCGS